MREEDAMEHDESERPEVIREGGGRIAEVNVPEEIEEQLRREREDGTAAKEEEELG
jgi:hypothetical protein